MECKIKYSEQMHLRSALAKKKKRQVTLTLSKPSEASADIFGSEELTVLLFKQNM